MKILLIAGGWSHERKISLSGARDIEKTLLSRGHSVTFFDLLTGFDQLLHAATEHEFAMINLHGAPGEDGLVQAMLDTANCPYQGTGPATSLLALHKAAAKQIFRYTGLPTPDWEFLPRPPDACWNPRLPYPLFAKSNTGGSSLLMGRARNRAELDARLAEIFSAGDEVLLEPELRGVEVTCGVLEENALPPLLIEPTAGDFFDYASKYAAGGARETCPAPLPEVTTAEVRRLALAAHRALGLTGYSRADFILTDNGTPTLLEVNTLPGMTATSLVPQEAAALGLDFGRMLEKLIKLGMRRKKA
ncbi:D-alanine--D-alanine ligase family protein [Candidatus Desulfovibrio trichonymphae]|uniref:D-alanine--D-alanine ligase n=1 Tax=Candidatus Desulfovibrio trichonymphae TaxID=1725232 RepID=A0A1J1DRR1_9BACT|nr:D-alanine--D-alanine ligase [Candidatus Desulfovibrio trichonymphae]BAV92551.1 D-alanine-D-alanine ligase [Candidatus Desulfovibrio trichonymphae]GHU89988.1 D-alanine--D-alanine ligase [Deltaproteobacteria bacterium]